MTARWRCLLSNISNLFSFLRHFSICRKWYMSAARFNMANAKDCGGDNYYYQPYKIKVSAALNHSFQKLLH